MAFFVFLLFVMAKWFKALLTLVFGAGVFLLWTLAYPQALGFREQNQLFLFTWDFLLERLSVPGGLSEWLSDFVIQFNHIAWLGAIITAAISVGIQILTWRIACRLGKYVKDTWYPLSFIPSVAILCLFGDIYVTMGYVIAVLLALALTDIYLSFRNTAFALAAVPVAFWLLGPAAWIFVIIAVLSEKKDILKRAALLIICSLTILLLFHYVLAVQYPWKQLLLGINYYQIPLAQPFGLYAAMAGTVIIPLIIAVLPEIRLGRIVCIIVQIALIIVSGLYLFRKCYDRDVYEILAYDQLIRNEKWEDVVSRAEEYQPKSEIGCVSVNLALFMTGRMAEMQNFYQTGTQGLLMPRVRDFISNISTGEAFWRLGFVNEALRYAFDTQESIPDLKKSPRAMMRMIDCRIVNGQYKVASKYIDILKHSLFYREWAEGREKFLFNERLVEADPVYHYLRTVRSHEDYLFRYPQMDRMLAKLYAQNNGNVMAGQYFMAWKQLKQMEEKR